MQTVPDFFRGSPTRWRLCRRIFTNDYGTRSSIVANLVMEVGTKDWEWPKYVEQSTKLNITYHDFISEYSGGSPKTICLNDMTIVALAGALNLPVISMEGRTSNSPNKRRIPDICFSENIEHLTFNDFLRRENIDISAQNAWLRTNALFQSSLAFTHFAAFPQPLKQIVANKPSLFCSSSLAYFCLSTETSA